MAFELFRDKPVQAGAVGGSAAPERVVLLVRSGCHLCAEARSAVFRVLAEVGGGLLELDVDADPVLAQRYGEAVPVVFVDGVQIDFWRVSESRLRAALLAV